MKNKTWEEISKIRMMTIYQQGLEQWYAYWLLKSFEQMLMKLSKRKIVWADSGIKRYFFI